MPVGTIRVLAGSQSVVVNITRSGGGSPAGYLDHGLTSAASFPATIAADTSFYFNAPDTLVVSAKMSGVECARPDGTTDTVVLSEDRFHTVSPALSLAQLAALEAALPARRGGTSAVVAPLPYFNAADYGAVGDGLSLTDVTTTTGAAANYQSTQAGFTPASVGKLVTAAGAGASGKALVATITGYVNPTTVTVSPAPVAAAPTVGFCGTDNSSALTAAFAAATGRKLQIPGGLYLYRTSLLLASDSHISGELAGSGDTTALVYCADDGTDAIYNPAGTYLSGTQVLDLALISCVAPSLTATVPGQSGHGFNLHGVTNGSAFIRVGVRNFRGDGFRFAKQTGVPGDSTVCGNVVFDQNFILSCGGYAFNITEGYVNATWNMPDVNSCGSGSFRFAGGASNQAQITIVGLWHEGNQVWSGPTAITLDTMGSQVVNLIGCNFQGGTTGVDAIKMVGGSVATPNLIGCTGFNFTNWINDAVNTKLVAFSSQITYARTMTSGSSLVQGAGANWRLRDTSQTPNQSQFGWSISGNLAVLRGYNDVGVSTGDILYVNLSTRQVEIVNDFKVDGKVGFYGTAPIAKQTGTPADASDLASALALVNSLKARLVALGVIA